MPIAQWVRRMSSQIGGQTCSGDRQTRRRRTGRNHLQLELLEDRRLLAVIGNNLAVGSELRHFRLAIAATAEYTAFHGGQASAFAEIQSVVDDLNQIFVPELAIRLDLVSNTNTVFTDPATDGYSNGQVDTMLGENSSILNNVLGSTAYDIGHVFGTLIGAGGAGVAGLGVVGSSAKAQGVSISSNPIGRAWTMLVAHEIGHQFGAEHTFNSSLGSCFGQRSGDTAYEPASGTTLMSYAGICGADNLAAEVIPIFHAASFEEIQILISSPPALPYSVTTLSNSIPAVDGGPDFIIPAGTPFELVAIGSDADAQDVLTYSWEQLDLGPPQGLPLVDLGSGPLFRVLEPSVAPNRVFPNLNALLESIDMASAGEVLPSTTRELNFRVTVRDGRGGVHSDDVLISVIDTGSSFAVTSPNTAVNWSGGSSQLVQWNVAGTNGGVINTSEVDILLSTDGGFTYPFLLSTADNDGSHTIDVPNIETSLARIRLQGSGSIFFDVSDHNFSITADPALPGLTIIESDGSTRPVEGGADDSYTIALNSAPEGNVTIQITADSQTLISIDGSPFASLVTAVFDSVDPKTVRVRAIDDDLLEGPHSSVISHSVISSSSTDYPVGMLLNNVVAAVYDNEAPPLVGVDFNLNTAGSTPLNWTSYLIPTNYSANTLTNLTRDDGVSTPYDLTFQYDLAGFGSFSSSQSAEAGTKPLHLPGLQAIDGINGANNGITITWSDLAAGHDYGVYVFGLAGPGDDAGQDVTISGAGAPITFTQTLDDRKLYVNDNIGDSRQPLVDYESVVTADPNGTIVVRVVPKAGSTNFSLAGLALRQVPMHVNAPEINVAGNGIKIVRGDTTPNVADGTDFGIVGVNSGSATSTYTIDNFTGTATLNVSSVTIVGSSDFSMAPFFPTSIPVGQSLSFDVIYMPTAVGTATATIEIISDDQNDSLYDFVVTGTGAMVAVPPAVQSVVINGGDNQRSSLTSVVVTFDSLVDVPDEAFSITNIGIPFDSTSTPVTGLLIDTTSVGSQTVATITFGSGNSIVDRVTANTLADGNYRLDITASQVTATGSGARMNNDFQFGATAADHFFRLFGDADGNGNVDFLDFSSAFLPAFGVSNTSPGYRDEMDADGDHDVDFLDFSHGFLPNFGRGRF